MTLAWNPDAATNNIAGYNIYYGGASLTYTNKISLGNVTNETVSKLASGAIYYFAATAVNASGLESAYSSEVAYTNPAATPPTIVLSSPTNGANYTAPATLDLTASVTTNGHTITKVQFYNGAALLGTAATTPYSYVWTNVSAGSYSLTAQVVYDSGSTVSSAPASVTVNAKKRPRLYVSTVPAGTGSSPEIVQPPQQVIILNATGGNPGLIYNIQSSPDLNTWTQIGAITLDSTGCCRFTNSVAASGAKGFYQLQGP